MAESDLKNAFPDSQKVSGNEEQDRISNLHDNILQLILSFLPIKEAVKTSILSKRWIHLWRFITSLHIDEKSIINSRLPVKCHSLENILNNFRSPIIHDFTLSGFSHSKYKTLVRSWISNILERKTQKLDIHYHGWKFNFPSMLFECNTLKEVNLQLKDCFFNVHTPIHHPNLQILCLTGLEFKNCSSSSEALLDFPLVKVFKLKECRFSNVRKLRINIPRAMRFVCKQSESYPYYSIELCAPSLTKLAIWLTCSPLPLFTQPVPSSIQYVSVESFLSCAQTRSQACELLQSMQALQYLKLGSFIMFKFCSLSRREHLLHGISSPVSSLPTFENLVCLQVEPTLISLSSLLCILLKTPVLETLIVCDKLSYPMTNSTLVLPMEVPPCFESHLKRVKIDTFVWEVGGRCLAKFVLKNAKVLEHMTLNLITHYSIKDVDGIVKKVVDELLKSSKGSPHVKVMVLA